MRSHLPQTIDIADIIAGITCRCVVLHNRFLVLSDIQTNPALNSANAVAYVPSAPSGIKDWNHRSVIINDNTGAKALAYVLGRDKYIR